MASLEIVLEKATKNYSDDEKVKLAEKKNSVYKELLGNLTIEDRLEGVTETLNELRKKGYLLAIGSSSKNTPYILKKIGLDTFFDAVSDGNNITHSKPDPEVFIKAAEFLHLPNTDCAIVEDAIAGVDAGKAANMVTFAVGDASKAKVADYSLEKFSDLLKTL